MGKTVAKPGWEWRERCAFYIWSGFMLRLSNTQARPTEEEMFLAQMVE